MRKALRVPVLFLILLSLIASGLLPAFTSVPARAAGGPAPAVDETPAYLILEVYGLILRHSVKRPEPSILVQSAINGLLNGLRDAHADCYTPEALERFRSDIHGTFGGVGIRVTESSDGCLLVLDVLPGCPAEAAGVLAGDRILAVDGVSIVGQGLEAADRIRGEPGTTVTVTILRGDEAPEILEIEIERALITQLSVSSSMLEGGTGYIRIDTFDQDTHFEFDRALQELAAQGMTGLVLDLRDNPGGLLDVCVKVAERLVPDRKVIVRVNWVDDTQVVRSRTRPDYVALEGVPYGRDGSFPWPVAVLIDGGTASAAEILAASLREAGVARLFGERTYGKGSVQSVIPLSNQGGIKLTTATWTTAEHGAIEGVGVTPDELVEPHIPPQPKEPTFTPVTDRWVFMRGDKGTDIVHLQERLKQLGYYRGPITGCFWSKTERALKAFQSSVGLEETGTTDPATVRALNSAKVADHPAGRLAGCEAGGQEPEGATGDAVLDRALEWLRVGAPEVDES